MTAHCLDCGKLRVIKARRLCGRCYVHRCNAGTLDERPMSVERVGGGLADAPLDVGISYRQLDHWVRKGWLQPGNATPGSGAWRTWGEEERGVARIMARLVVAGIPPELAHRVARAGGSAELAPGIRIEVGESA